MYNYPGAQIATPQLYQNSFTNSLQNGQEVIRVNGVSGAYQCPLPPGTKSILVTDTEQPLAYLITTDGVNRNVTTFDIALHQEPIQQQSSSNNSLEDTLQQVLNKLDNLEGEVNELKSNSGSSGSEQSYKQYNKSKSNGSSNASSH